VGLSASESRLPWFCDGSLALGPSWRVRRICSSSGLVLLVEAEGVCHGSDEETAMLAMKGTGELQEKEVRKRVMKSFE
jgi:hypothetical protein